MLFRSVKPQLLSELRSLQVI